MTIAQRRERLYRQLEALYQELAEALPAPPGNPCGTCKTCCTAAGLTRHRVIDLELDFMARNIGQEATERFRTYLAKVKDERGNYLYPVCPNYDEERHGCGVYPYRPYACRVFGHYREEQSQLPEGCVFIGSEVVFRTGLYYEIMPLSARLRRCWREYDLLGASPAASACYVHKPLDPVAEEALEFLNRGDACDRVVALQAQGLFAEAIDELDRAEAEPESLYPRYARAVLYSMLDRHPQALEAFEELARELPERADLHFYAGYHGLLLGRTQDGMTHLEAAVALEPRHAMALGFLGYQHLQAGRLEQAVEYLGRALEVDPENGFFQLRLGATLQALGRLEQARPHLEYALRFEATAPEAGRLLP